MPTHLKIEKIEAAEAAIRDLHATEKSERTRFMADGHLDDNERRALDRIKGKVVKLGVVVATLKAEMERSRKAWLARAADWTRAQERRDTLNGFGHPGTKAVAEALAPIPTAVEDQRWTDASAQLDKAETVLAPQWKDYVLQAKARTEYEKLRPALDLGLAAAEVAEPATEAVAAALSPVRAAMPAMDDCVAACNYLGALASARKAGKDLAATEAIIADLKASQAAYHAAREPLDPVLLATASCEFAALAPMHTEKLTTFDAMEAAAAIHDYTAAMHGLDALSLILDALVAAGEALVQERGDYETGLAALQPRIDATASSEFASLADLQERVRSVDAAMRDKASAEDYVGALVDQAEVAAALDIFEATVDARTLYEVRMAPLMPRLDDALEMRPGWGYLEPLQTETGTTRLAMEQAALAEDFGSAMRAAAILEGKLAEMAQMMAAKRVEYDAARARLDHRLGHVAECKYYVPKEKADVDTAVAGIAAPLVAEDWVGALEAVQEAAAAMDRYDAAHAAWDAQLREAIALDLAPMKQALKDSGSVTSSTKVALTRLVAKVDAALAGTGDIDDLQADLTDNLHLLDELKMVTEVAERLVKAGFLGGDDEARRIVAEYGPEKLAKLPLEARNRLVKELITGGVGEDDHDAIQAIWASPSIDKRFDALDQEVRDRMMKAFRDSPEMAKLATAWPRMSREDKEAALKDIAAIPAGPEGWNVGVPENISGDPKVFVGEAAGALAFYNEERDMFAVNLAAPRMFSLAEVMSATTHEIGHRYQHALVERLDPGHPDRLRPGDAEYDEAVALKLNDHYLNVHQEHLAEMVNQENGAPFYSGTPAETQSRLSQNAVLDALNGAYGTHTPAEF
jgi:hypothetical protein